MALLFVAATATTAWPSCDSSNSGAAPRDFDPGPTFGAEVAVTVLGRGRVTGPEGLDCPGSCFARILLAKPSADGAPDDVSLRVDITNGAHFEGWRLDSVDLGLRARGPSQCSPMMRRTSPKDLDLASMRSTTIAVALGETKGIPPKGREEECAAFTTVPLAYAITAVFADEVFPPFPDASDFDAGNPEVLFEPPAGATGPAREIGVTRGNVYWRFEKSGTALSGIALGSTGGGGASVILSPLDIINFDVDVHVAYQRGSGGAGQVEVIEGSTTARTIMGGAPTCAALATDATKVYCRSPGGAGSTLYSWPISGGLAPTTVYQLPRGNDLAVDDATQRVYFSDDPGTFNGDAIVESTPRAGDGGAPQSITQLAFNQYGPQHLHVGTANLFWIDNRGGGVFVATSAPKFGAGVVQMGVSGPNVRFVAADPDNATTYWVGLSAATANQSAILRASTTSVSTTPFRASLPSVNGLAVDATFVYWTQNDGRVYRAEKNPPKL